MALANTGRKEGIRRYFAHFWAQPELYEGLLNSLYLKIYLYAKKLLSIGDVSGLQSN